MKHRIAVIILLVCLTASESFGRDIKIGPAGKDTYVASTRQLIRPAGQSLSFSGRPVDLALSPDGKTVYVKTNISLLVVDAASWTIRQELPLDTPGSYHGIAVTADGSKVYVSTARNALIEFSVAADGVVSVGRKIEIPGVAEKVSSTPCGIALLPDRKKACVCLSRNNTLAVLDLASGAVEKEIPVGIAPFDVVLSPDGLTAWVSNWGGRRARQGDRTQTSAGTPTPTDERSVACTGTVSLVDLVDGKEIAQVGTGLHPSDLELDSHRGLLYVGNANSDTLSVINTRRRRVVRSIVVKPDDSLPFGSAPNAVTLCGDTLYVAVGGNNAIAVIGAAPKGFIPTAWYPGAVVTDGKYLYIANIKGYGSRDPKKNVSGWPIHSPLGTVQKVAIPDSPQLASYTKQVISDSRVPEALRAMEKAAAGVKPAVIPENSGEPSLIEHVFYIIKENKTYDQLFGDMPRGNSDPNMCQFGKQVTPNQHALADQFVLLDNYYCNGVCSADGHQWTTQGYATDYLEKAFGGWPRSYPFAGDDPMAYASSGFIWDNVLLHGLSFRNYGEMARTVGVEGSFTDIYKQHLNKVEKYPFKPVFSIDPLERYSCPQYPGWTLVVPDQVRADIVLRELADCEKTRRPWPNLVTIHLPNDHTVGLSPGQPTPNAHVADNDLAVARIVEGVSKSSIWPKTCIFVIEDDPQSGVDHVDGHRSICLVISPYAKRGALVSQFYNQTSVLRTMELMLGLPPMNQMDAMSPVMRECFNDKPDLTPYVAIPSNVNLTDTNPQKNALSGPALYWAEKSLEQRLDGPDMVDDDVFNRIVWFATKGPDIPYPSHFAGAHGSGLEALHLALAVGGDEDDDD